MQLIPNTAPLSTLLTASHATLTITNQKNGRRGQSIHHECTGLLTSPVKSLARRVAHIMAHTTDSNTALSTWYHPTLGPQQIRPAHINNTVKQACTSLGLQHCGFTPDKVSSHSLRAGGAMAMHLNGCDELLIKKQGRWTSNTFMMYIHEQITALSNGIASRMSHHIPYFSTTPGPALQS